MREVQIDQHGFILEEGEEPVTDKELARLLRSKTIREVYAGRKSPEALDRDVADLRRDCKRWKQTAQMERAEVMRLRRLIGMMEESCDGRRKRLV